MANKPETSDVKMSIIGMVMQMSPDQLNSVNSYAHGLIDMKKILSKKDG